jgi:Spy/CpxP family protein refolding chaperone
MSAIQGPMRPIEGPAAKGANTVKKFVIALAITATAALAWAAPHPKFAETLGLSDAQKQQMREIRQASREKNSQLFSDFKAKRDEMRRLRQAGDPRAEQLRTEMKAMRQQVSAARKARREQMMGALTQEQRGRLKR